MKCRICGNAKFETVLNMGKAPLVNSLLEKKDLKGRERTYPLVVMRCSKCSLAQLKTIVDSHKIYQDQDYLYYTGDMPQQSQYMRAFDSLVTEIRKHTKQNDLIVEIGSNDGTVLSKMKEGRRILGVDPAINVVIRALSRGVPTLAAPISKHNAFVIKQEFGPAKVVGGANCLAHIDNIHGVMEGVTELLADDGIFWAEVNYWGGMVKHRHYALVYLDHYSYFSLKNWIDLGRMHGLEVFDAFVTEAQGEGLSLRLFASRDKKRAKTERFKKLLAEEQKTKLNTAKAAVEYGKGCKLEAQKLYKLVTSLKKQGKSIAGYGAAAKGFSILQLAGITQKHIDYFVDDSPAKQGKYTPVTHIPVISRKEAEKRLPDYFFITAPNYADVIIAKEQNFIKKGGKFILADSRIVS